MPLREATLISRQVSVLTSIQENILSTLLYFDVFDYPLTAAEIRNTVSSPLASLTTLREELTSLVAQGILFCEDGYYYLRDKKIISQRKENTQRARRYKPYVPGFAKLISRFPFVRCVCISGSLSKGVMQPEGDIDYFIITEPGRLWVCRTLLVAFKKLFLLNSKKYFCVNYFISSDNLEIPDKNIFTATEIAYLIPVYNSELYSRFMKANAWHRNQYPAFRHPLAIPCFEKSSGLQHVMEKLLGGKAGGWMDKLFFRITLSRWKKKFGHFNPRDFEITLRSRNDVSKHHPNHFQKKVIQRLERNTREFELAHGIHLYHGKGTAHT